MLVQHVDAFSYSPWIVHDAFFDHLHDVATRWQEAQSVFASPATSSWTTSPESYAIRVRVPELEPESVTASLAAEGASLELTGKRKFAGCSCEPASLVTVPLPYRPRAEDVDLVLDDTKNLVTVTLARKAKADSPTQLDVKRAPPPGETRDENQESTRPLRFVPHISAAATAEPTLEQQETKLADKFRNIAAKASALAVKETDASNPLTSPSNPLTSPSPEDATADLGATATDDAKGAPADPVDATSQA